MSEIFEPKLLTISKRPVTGERTAVAGLSEVAADLAHQVKPPTDRPPRVT